MAAKTKTQTVSAFRLKAKIKRKGIHAKTKNSKSKNSKNYHKRYIGQG